MITTPEGLSAVRDNLGGRYRLNADIDLSGKENLLFSRLDESLPRHVAGLESCLSIEEIHDVGGYIRMHQYLTDEYHLNPLNWDGREWQSAIAYRRSKREKQPRKGFAPRVTVT